MVSFADLPLDKGNITLKLYICYNSPMGCMVELNTLIGLPADFDTETLEVGKRYSIPKVRQRAFPVGVAMLVVDKRWNFYGYGVARSTTVNDQETQIEFEMLTKFPPDISELYKTNFITAAKMTGEVK
jgi:hypothetical protein